MSGPNCILDKGFVIDAAATGVDFGLAVMFADAAGKTVKLTTGAASTTVFCVGVAQDTIDDAKIATGKAVVSIRMVGITRAVAGGTGILVGDAVTTDATGRFVRTVAAGAQVVGRAMSPAANIGDHFNLLLTPGGSI
jgi:hypothetical protein